MVTIVIEPFGKVPQVALEQTLVYFAQGNTTVAQHFHNAIGCIGCRQGQNIAAFTVIKILGKKIHLNLTLDKIFSFFK